MNHDIHAEAKRKSAIVGTRRKLAEFTEKEIVSMPREQFLGLLSPVTRRHLRAAWAASDAAKKRRR